MRLNEIVERRGFNRNTKLYDVLKLTYILILRIAHSIAVTTSFAGPRTERAPQRHVFAVHRLDCTALRRSALENDSFPKVNYMLRRSVLRI